MRKIAFAALMSLQLGALHVESARAAASSDPFRDVDENHWAYPAVDWLRQQGLLEGWGQRFHGRRHFSRYEMAEILARFTQMLEEAHPGATGVLRRATRKANLSGDSKQLLSRLREIRRGFTSDPSAPQMAGDGKSLRQLQADLERVAALVATHQVLLETPRGQGPWRRRLHRSQKRQKSAKVGRKLQLSTAPPDPAKASLMKELDLLTAAERRKAEEIETGALRVKSALAARGGADADPHSIRSRLALARNLRSGDSRPQPLPEWKARPKAVKAEPVLDTTAARELARPAGGPPAKRRRAAPAAPAKATGVARARQERIAKIKALVQKTTARKAPPVERIQTPPPTTPASPEAVPATLAPLQQPTPRHAPAPAQVLAAAGSFAKTRRTTHEKRPAAPKSPPKLAKVPAPSPAPAVAKPRQPTPLERKQMLLAAAETARQRSEAARKAAARRAALRSRPTEVVTLEQLKSPGATRPRPAPRTPRRAGGSASRVTGAREQVARARKAAPRRPMKLSATRARAIALARGEPVPATRPPAVRREPPAASRTHQRALAQLAARPSPAPRPQGPPRFAPAAPVPPAPPVNLDPASAQRLASALRDVKSGRIQGHHAQVILRLASAAIHASRY